MKSSAPVRLLKDLVTDGRAELQTGPFGTQLHASAYVENGVPVVAVKNIGDNKIIANGIPQVSTEDADRLRRYKLLPGDLLFSRKGAVERRAMVGSDERGWLQGSDCIRLRVDDSIDARYVSFVLGSAESRQWLVQHAHGATMPSLNQQILGLFPLPLPDRKVQKSIAHILGTLDDKIELNRQMNGTLDEIARTLFRSWFVTFDPVRAKAEGRQPEGMDADTAALFPDRFVDSELGPIPEGWSTGPFTTLAKAIGGGTPKTSVPEYWDGDISWFAMADLPSNGSPFVINTEKKITVSGEAKSSAKRVPKDTTILTARGTVGETVIAGVEMAFNQSCYAIRPANEDIGPYTLFLLTRSQVHTMRSRAHGSVFSTITRGTLDSLLVPISNKAILGVMEEIISPLFGMMLANSLESQTLIELRDTLLPELLSGRVRASLVADV
jgi:type I restriction enzyme S subunit